MDERERASAAQAFNVRTESIDQIQALGIDDAPHINYSACGMRPK
jgi:hypothetical protein